VVEDYASLLKEAQRLYRREQAKKAAALAERAIALHPDGDGAMVLLGNCELDQGNTSAAQAWADKAISANARNADAYLLKGAVLQQKDQTAEAKKFYQKYLDLAPNGKYAEDVRTIVNSL
jgi:tetratricopeptide (TPR) repeat protein